jgi:hypothetical protein
VTQQPERCLSCGEDTSIGSVFYSDRLVDRHVGEARYLCSLCARRAMGLRKGRAMTDEERAELEKAAFVLGSFAPGPH